MADSVNKLNPGVLNRLYKWAVPVNARTLIETALGSTAPITEADFTPEELEILRSAYRNANETNMKDEADLRDEISRSSTYAKFLKNHPGLSDVDRGFYDAWLKYKKADLATYENTKDKTSVGYFDYPKGGISVKDGWWDAVKKSYTDPNYRMKTTLGAYNVVDTPKGKRAIDKYNFDSTDLYYENYGIDPQRNSYMNILRAGYKNPIDLIDMTMNKLAPRSSRSVNIKLGD